MYRHRDSVREHFIVGNIGKDTKMIVLKMKLQNLKLFAQKSLMVNACRCFSRYINASTEHIDENPKIKCTCSAYGSHTTFDYRRKLNG